MATQAAATFKQATYVSQGKDSKGKVTKGEIPGASIALVKAQLRKQGINATKVKKKGKDLFAISKPKIKPMDIAIFTRQLATMMKAGIPLVQSFEVVGGGLENASMREVVFAIRDDVASGNNFADSIRKFPRLFDDLFCNLVDAGEQAGALKSMLDKCATFYEAEVDNAVDGLTAMMEPLIMAVLGVLVGGLMIAMYMPIFQIGSVV